MKRIGVVIPVLLFVALMLPLRGGFTDDGFIHIQYARNIVTLGEYSFNPGLVSFGTTSPLWVMMLAAIGRFFGTGDNLIVASRVLSWLAGLASLFVVYRFGRAIGMSRTFATLCALGLAGHVWHVRWTALGMETSTAVLLSAAVGAASIGAFGDRRRAVMTGAFMALAALIRPEAYLFVPVYVVAALTCRRKAWSHVVATLALWALLIVPWLLFARFYIGGFLPNTAGAKSGGLVVNPLVFIQKMEPVAKIVASAEGIFVVLILLSLALARRRARVLSEPCRFLLLWTIALPTAYVLFDIQVLSRYMLLASPFTIVLGVLALEDVVDALRVARKPLVATAVVALSATVNAVFYMTIVLPPSQAFSYDLTHRLKALAVYLDENADDGAVVAAADIGYLAFYSRCHVLDLGGLVEPVTNALRERYDYEEIVDRGLYLQLDAYPRVHYFIDRVKEANRFDGVTLAGYRFESMRVEEIRNLGIRKPGPWYYTLYRLHPVNDD